MRTSIADHELSRRMLRFELQQLVQCDRTGKTSQKARTMTQVQTDTTARFRSQSTETSVTNAAKVLEGKWAPDLSQAAESPRTKTRTAEIKWSFQNCEMKAVEDHLDHIGFPGQRGGLAASRFSTTCTAIALAV